MKQRMHRFSERFDCRSSRFRACVTYRRRSILEEERWGRFSLWKYPPLPAMLRFHRLTACLCGISSCWKHRDKKEGAKHKSDWNMFKTVLLLKAFLHSLAEPQKLLISVVLKVKVLWVTTLRLWRSSVNRTSSPSALPMAVCVCVCVPPVFVKTNAVLDLKSEGFVGRGGIYASTCTCKWLPGLLLFMERPRTLPCGANELWHNIHHSMLQSKGKTIVEQQKHAACIKSTNRKKCPNLLASGIRQAQTWKQSTRASGIKPRATGTSTPPQDWYLKTALCQLACGNLIQHKFNFVCVCHEIIV